MTKMHILTLIITLILVSILTISSCNYSYAKTIEDTSLSSVIIDSMSARILYEKNAMQQLPIANTTKILTAIIALERCDIDDLITVSNRASNVEGTSLWLEEGETQKLEDLLYGLILTSGNDAAIAIAEHIDGDVEQFSITMTQKAKEIGAFNTQFKNPHGLDQEGHYSTAYDMALITRYALKDKRFKEIINTPERNIPWPGHNRDKLLRNKNILEGCNGIKIGNTKNAGNCIVSFKEIDGVEIIAVTLNSAKNSQQHINMFDYVSNNYKIETICTQNEIMKTIPVIKGKKNRALLIASLDLSIPIKEDEKKDIKIKYHVPDFIEAPIIHCKSYGNIELFLGDMSYGHVDLIASENIQKRDIKISFSKILKSWLYCLIR